MEYEFDPEKSERIGLAHELALTVVYTDRTGKRGEPVRRIISARRSNRRERREFKDAIGP